MYVDAHVHVVAPGLGVRAEAVPPSAVGEFFDVDRILEQTRADRVILSPWVQLLDLDARLHNAALAELVSDRVAVLGAAPEMTADALRAAMDSGLAGVEVTARVDGDYLGADRFAPFWAAAQETGALVFVHPSTRGFSGPGDFYLWNTVGNPVETTITAAHLVMAGVLERHPDLRVLLAHGGGAVLGLRGRLRHAHEHLGAARTALNEPVDDSLRRLYFDTVVFDPAILRAVVEFAGADHVLAGSDHPFDMGDPDPTATVRAAGLDPADEAAILGGNAERLLG
jgi:aminocarboxymuconate-semialdehyde decarboxylase